MNAQIHVTPTTRPDHSAEGACTTFRWVPVAQIGAIVEMIERLNKKAARLHCAGLEMVTVGGTVVRHVAHRKVNYGTAMYYERVNSSKPIVRNGEIASKTIDMVKVGITGVQPTIRGHKLIAAIDHLRGGEEGTSSLVIRRCPDVDEDVHALAKPDSTCDHCAVQRDRNTVYLLRNLETGATSQVGGSCLIHYTGGKDVEKLLAFWAEVGGEMVRLLDSEDRGTGGAWLLDTRKYLVRVAQVIRKLGWISKKTAEERSTRSTATEALLAYDWSSKTNQPQPEEPTQADVWTALRAIVWARRSNPTSDFGYTIKSIAGQSLINEKFQGFAAAIVSAYLRDREKLNTATALYAGWDSSKTIAGTNRRDFRVRMLMNPKAIEGQFGTTFLMKFLDLDSGAMLVTFASEGIEEKRPEDFRIGSEFTLKATLSGKISEYQGAKQTGISRIAWGSVLTKATL